MTSICASCTSLKLTTSVVSDPNKKPQWLSERDFVTEFIDSVKTMLPKYPTRYDQEVKIDLGKLNKHRVLLYWATRPSSSLEVSGAKSAYGKFENNGIVKLDKEGKGVLRMECPQIYKTKRKNSKKEESFYKHFHYVFGNEKSGEWLPTLYTHLIICNRSIDYVYKELNKGTSVLINALPAEYYGKDHIPNSYNLHHKQVKQMSIKELQKWLYYVIEKHYPVIDEMLKSKKIDITEVPIIGYCAHEKCNASDMMEKELLKKGMLRVDNYAGGMKEYNKNA